MNQKRNFFCLVSVLLAGCANLLPRADTQQPSSFDSFEAASIAFDKIVGYQTTVDEMRQLGFDLRAAANITVIPLPAVDAASDARPGCAL